MLCRNLHRFSLILLLLIYFHGVSTLAEASIQQYFSELTQYRFTKLHEILTTEERNEVGSFTSQVLDDYVLFSYSAWEVHPMSSQRPALQIEVYEMQDGLGAFGLFSVATDIWQKKSMGRLNLQVDNLYQDGTLLLWRGNYFFHLTSTPSASAIRTKQSFQELGNALVEALPLLNLHPMTVIHLPRGGLAQESIRFYLGRTSFALNAQFPKNMISQIGFEDQIEVTHARYGRDRNSLFLVGYPTVDLADYYFLKLQDAMQSYFFADGVYMKRSGVIISIFFGPESEARPVLEKVNYAPTIKWVYQKNIDPARLRRQSTTSFLSVVARSLLLAMVFCAFTIATGLTVGVIRYQLFRRFPILRRKDEMISLNLAAR